MITQAHIAILNKKCSPPQFRHLSPHLPNDLFLPYIDRNSKYSIEPFSSGETKGKEKYFHQPKSTKSRERKKDTRDMPQPTTETPHHSWVAPSSQGCQSIIENRTESPPAAKVDDDQQQPFTDIPPLPRRSSYNYEHDSARSPSFSAEQAAGKTIRTDDNGKPLHHERQRSFSREDQKRLAHAFMMTEGDTKSFTEKD